MVNASLAIRDLHMCVFVGIHLMASIMCLRACQFSPPHLRPKPSAQLSSSGSHEPCSMSASVFICAYHIRTRHRSEMMKHTQTHTHTRTSRGHLTHALVFAVIRASICLQRCRFFGARVESFGLCLHSVAVGRCPGWPPMCVVDAAAIEVRLIVS